MSVGIAFFGIAAFSASNTHSCVQGTHEGTRAHVIHVAEEEEDRGGGGGGGGGRFFKADAVNEEEEEESLRRRKVYSKLTQ